MFEAISANGLIGKCRTYLTWTVSAKVVHLIASIAFPCLVEGASLTNWDEGFEEDLGLFMCHQCSEVDDVVGLFSPALSALSES